MHKNSVLFYTQNRWAFGQIHHSLIKRLWSHGIYAHLLDWTQSYSQLEFDLLNKKFETFVTTPEAVEHLKQRGIPLSRIVSIAHHEKDITSAVTDYGVSNFEELKGYGVINNSLIDVSKKLGIKRIPFTLKVGIDFDHFYLPVNKTLEVIGYAGEIKSSMSDGSDFKRSYLIPSIIDRVKLPLRSHEFFNHLCMSGYYTLIDALLVSSNYETAGLPAMEAAAAGKLVISPAVGYFDGSFGVLCRTPDQEFLEDAVETIERFKDPVLYKNICLSSQQCIKDHFDWSVLIKDWINIIYNP